MDFAEKTQKCHEYVEALEEEKGKIQVFKRELPLCLELVTQAIETCKRELSGTTAEYMLVQSEFSEQTSSDDHHGPVLEEFMPIKRSTHHSTTCSDNNDDEDDHQEEHSAHEPKENEMNGGDQKKKSEWLRSVQLWNPSSDPAKQDLPRKAVVTEVKMNGSTGGAFQPFNKDKSNGKSCSSNNVDTNNQVTIKAAAASVPASSTAEPVVNGGCNKEEKDSQRKQRRCWSPELHRRFLHALQQLGGSHVATPKQIRELMKVEGLTNDEVKSHLQKYRLHTRRPNHRHNNNNNNNPQPPQFVVVGGIWVPPAEYEAVTGSGETATIAAPNGIYAPVATAPAVTISPAQKPRWTYSDNLQSEGTSSRCKDGGAHSNNSPATSSSTHNTSTSPAVF